jgi:hypothetical protein
MPDGEDHLAQATRHVTEARLIVARQRERIAQLRALGMSTMDAEQTLDIFLSSLRIFEDDECRLREDAAKRRGRRVS